MKKYFVAGALLALAGCRGAEVPPPANGLEPAPAATIAAVQSSPAQSCEENGFYTPLPDKAIRFAFPFRVARDRVYANAGGETRRGLTIEYLSGNADEVWSGIVESMKAAGFHATGTDSGQPQATFVKQGMPSVYLALTPEAGANPTGPDVLGSVWISWRIDGSGSKK